MAASDYMDRLRWIQESGQRQSDYDANRYQRARTKRDFMQDLANQKKRLIDFIATIPPQDYQKQRIQPPQMDNGSGSSDLTYKGLLQYPLKGKHRISSDFGHRTHPISGKSSNHSGVDWAAGSGTPIYAPADATVRRAGWDKIYGNQTILDIGSGRSLMFGHQKGFAIEPGQRIRAGQLIGYVGSTGWSTGPHLHFETWINNKPVNPLSWFS